MIATVLPVLFWFAYLANQRPDGLSPTITPPPTPQETTTYPSVKTGTDRYPLDFDSPPTPTPRNITPGAASVKRGMGPTHEFAPFVVGNLTHNIKSGNFTPGAARTDDVKSANFTPGAARNREEEEPEVPSITVTIDVKSANFTPGAASIDNVKSANFTPGAARIEGPEVTSAAERIEDANAYSTNTKGVYDASLTTGTASMGMHDMLSTLEAGLQHQLGSMFSSVGVSGHHMLKRSVSNEEKLRSRWASNEEKLRLAGQSPLAPSPLETKRIQQKFAKRFAKATSMLYGMPVTAKTAPLVPLYYATRQSTEKPDGSRSLFSIFTRIVLENLLSKERKEQAEIAALNQKSKTPTQDWNRVVSKEPKELKGSVATFLQQGRQYELHLSGSDGEMEESAPLAQDRADGSLEAPHIQQERKETSVLIFPNVGREGKLSNEGSDEVRDRIPHHGSTSIPLAAPSPIASQTDSGSMDTSKESEVAIVEDGRMELASNGLKTAVEAGALVEDGDDEKVSRERREASSEYEDIGGRSSEGRRSRERDFESSGQKENRRSYINNWLSKLSNIKDWITGSKTPEQLFSAVNDTAEMITHNVVFRRVGKFARSSQIGHLVLHVSPQNLTKAVSNLRKDVSLLQIRHGKQWQTYFPSDKGGLTSLSMEYLDRTDAAIQEVNLLFSQLEVRENLAPPRQKRQVLVAMGLGVAASLGMGTYSVFESASMQDILRNVSSRINLIAEVIQSDETTISKDHRAVFELQKTFGAALKSMAVVSDKQGLTKIRDDAIRTSERTYSIVYNWAMQMRLLFNQRLAPGLVDLTILKQSFNAMVTKAVGFGLEPLDTDYRSLFTREISVYRTGEEFGDYAIVVHVPFVRAEHFDLYRYSAVPQNLNAHVALKISSPKPLLAVNKERTIIKEFEEVELAQCDRHYDLFYCPHDKILNQKPKESCMYNLLMANSDAVNSTCKFSFVKAGEFVHQITPNSFDISSPYPTAITYDCDTGDMRTHNQTFLEEFDGFNVEPGCKATTPGHVVQVENDIEIHADFKVKKLNFSLDEYFPNITGEQFRRLGQQIHQFPAAEVPSQIAAIWNQVHLNYEDSLAFSFPNLAKIFGPLGAKLLFYLGVPVILFLVVMGILTCGGTSCIRGFLRFLCCAPCRKCQGIRPLEEEEYGTHGAEEEGQEPKRKRRFLGLRIKRRRNNTTPNAKVTRRKGPRVTFEGILKRVSRYGQQPAFNDQPMEPIRIPPAPQTQDGPKEDIYDPTAPPSTYAGGLEARGDLTNEEILRKRRLRKLRENEIEVASSVGYEYPPSDTSDVEEGTYINGGNTPGAARRYPHADLQALRQLEMQELERARRGDRVVLGTIGTPARSSARGNPFRPGPAIRKLEQSPPQQ